MTWLKRKNMKSFVMAMEENENTWVIAEKGLTCRRDSGVIWWYVRSVKTEYQEKETIYD